MASVHKEKLYSSTSAWREGLLLLGLTLVLAAGAWIVRTPRLPLTADLSLYELELGAPVMQPAEAILAYVGNTHMFVDTRTTAIDRRSIPGSLNLRPESFDDDLREIYDFIVPEDPLILYGDGNLILISNVAVKLQERGFFNVTILVGDLNAWQDAGGDLTPLTEVSP